MLNLKAYWWPLIILLIVFSVLFSYDFSVGNNDGIIGKVYFYRVFFRAGIIALYISTFLYFSREKKGWLSIISTNLLSFLGILIFLEVASFIYISATSKDIKKPSFILLYDNPSYEPGITKENKMWGDLNDSVGRWRLPSSQVVHDRCGDNAKITYKTNALGLRDTEQQKNDSNRVVFLGDSFVEGFMINVENRLSNLLQDTTRTKYVNLGITGANPTSYYLIYKHIAKPNYDHDKVIVGIFQGNDFEHFAHPVNGGFLNSPIYRPFWNTSEKDTVIDYTLTRKTLSCATLNEADFKNLRWSRDSLYSSQNLGRKLLLELETNSYLWSLILDVGKNIALDRYKNHYVSYYEEPGWDTPRVFEFKKGLSSLLKEIGDKKVLLLIIPDQKDVENYKKNKINNYTPYLEKNYKSKNVEVIDLLPAFAASNKAPADYFIQCDGHWNEEGNRFAMQYLLSDPTFQNFAK